MKRFGQSPDYLSDSNESRKNDYAMIGDKRIIMPHTLFICLPILYGSDEGSVQRTLI